MGKHQKGCKPLTVIYLNRAANIFVRVSVHLSDDYYAVYSGIGIASGSPRGTFYSHDLSPLPERMRLLPQIGNPMI